MKEKLQQISLRPLTDEPLNDWLGNWTLLSMKLTERNLSEDELLRLIKLELRGKGRYQILDRLYSRYNRVRSIRERKEIVDARKRSRGVPA